MGRAPAKGKVVLAPSLLHVSRDNKTTSFDKPLALAQMTHENIAGMHMTVEALVAKQTRIERCAAASKSLHESAV